MEIITARRLLENIKDKYRFDQENVDFGDLKIVIMVMSEILSRLDSNKDPENKNYYSNADECLFTRDNL